MNQNGSSIIVALDYQSASQTLEFVDTLDPKLCRLKVGKELFTREGPAVVSALVSRGFDVFLDLKYHDIPNTVAGACSAAADLGVWMVNVHASGGTRMMEAARTAVEASGTSMLLIGVTVLTSMDSSDLFELSVQGTPEEHVMRLARLAQSSGLDGIVCSAKEVQMIKQAFGTDFLAVTPGIRPKGSEQDDQRRIVTPADARQLGVDYMVVGRPITQASEPLMALANIHSEYESVKQ